MALTIAFLFALILATTQIGRRAASAPALLMLAGGAASLLYRGAGLPNVSAVNAAIAAEAGLAALAFISAAQFRTSRLIHQCPTAARLTLGGAPIFLIICSLSAYILLPQLNPAAALLLGATLMLNGAAFDRRAVVNAPAPAEVKAAVRIESAAIIGLGAPVALLLAANATAASAHEAPLAPLLEGSLAALKGFALGGVVGLAAAHLGNRFTRDGAGALRRNRGLIIAAAAIWSFLAAPAIGAEPIIAAFAAGLLWGEDTNARQSARLRLRRIVEQGVAPLTYLSFGCLFAPRILQADLLSIVFALAAVTIMRAGPRLAVLQSSTLAKESQVFLAWFGGAPGAASALFLIMLLGNPALGAQDGLLTVGALAVFVGVLAARLTSRPLANAYLRASALASKRRMFASL